MPSSILAVLFLFYAIQVLSIMGMEDTPLSLELLSQNKKEYLTLLARFWSLPKELQEHIAKIMLSSSHPTQPSDLGAYRYELRYSVFPNVWQHTDDLSFIHDQHRESSFLEQKIMCRWQYEDADLGLEYYDIALKKWVTVDVYNEQSPPSSKLENFKVVGPNANGMAIIEPGTQAAWLCKLKAKMDLMIDSRNTVRRTFPKQNLIIRGTIACIHPRKHYFSSVDKDGAIYVYGYADFNKEPVEYSAYKPAADLLSTFATSYAYELEFGKVHSLFILQKAKARAISKKSETDIAEHSGKLQMIDWRTQTLRKLIDINKVLANSNTAECAQEEYEIVHFDYSYQQPTLLLLSYQNKNSKDRMHYVAVYNIETDACYKVPVPYMSSAFTYVQPEHIGWANKFHNYRAQRIYKFIPTRLQHKTVDEMDKIRKEYASRLAHRNSFFALEVPCIADFVNKKLVSAVYNILKIEEPLSDFNESMLKLKSQIDQKLITNSQE